MKNKFTSTCKKLTALLMAVCLICTAMVTVKPVKAEAFGLSDIPISAVLEYGGKAALFGAIKFSDSIESDDLEDFLDTVNRFVYGKAFSAAEDTRLMCEEILKELAVMKKDISEYSAAISSSIEKQKASQAREAFNQKWAQDVDSVISTSLSNAVKAYVKYLVVSEINVNGMPEDEATKEFLADFWKNKLHQNFATQSFSDSAVISARNEMEKAFISIYDPINNIKAKDSAYRSAYIYNEFYNAINTLSDNFVYDNVATNERQYTVVEKAATDAYFNLPFSHQQYEYVTARAREQVMHTNLLQMAFSEYLLMQGEYLKENAGDNANWKTDVNLPFNNVSNASSVTSYDNCITQFEALADKVLREEGYLFTSDIHIDTFPYTGINQNIVRTFDGYMKPEDVTTVELKIEKFENSFNYRYTINCTEAGGHKGNMDLGNTVTDKKNIGSTLRFHRVMSGGVNPEIFYILDASQFEDKAALDFIMSKFHVKRYGMYGGSDPLYGDLYLPSNDFRNLIKNMTDGTNTFSVPKNPGEELKNLTDVPYYGAVSEYKFESFLSDYLPHKGSGDTYLLTSEYANNLDEGGWTMCKYASFKVGNISSEESKSGVIKTETVSLEDLTSGHNTAVVLRNTGDTFSQKATAKINTSAGGTGDIRIVSDTATVEAGQTGVIKSGDMVSVQFKPEDINMFKSLKLHRHNTETTTKELISSVEELKMLPKTDDGYFVFEMAMPYSECSFELETRAVLEQNAKGEYLVNNFDDLCKVASLVNSGESKYAEATYLLTSDIDCTGENPANRRMIGTSSIIFNGTFDGQGHTISNLNHGVDIEGDGAGNTHGLFAILGENATVKYLTVDGANVWSDDSTAEGSAVIAKQNFGEIKSCTVKNSTIQLGDSNFLGGITGVNYGTLNGCHAIKLTLVRRGDAENKRAMGNICEENHGKMLWCSVQNGTFVNGSIKDNMTHAAVDTTLGYTAI